MRDCNTGGPLETFHERELSSFQRAVRHPELAVAQALRYCADEQICAPAWVVKDAADLVCSLLLHQKCNQRGRNAGLIARYRQDYRDFERYDAVMEIRRSRKRLMSNVKLLRQALRQAQRQLKAQIRKARNEDSEKLRDLRRGVAAFERRLSYEEKWVAWFRNGTFECASRYLAGRDARVGADGMKASYQKVQKALKDPLERTRYAIFEECFLEYFGFPDLHYRKPGTKFLLLHDITN